MPLYDYRIVPRNTLASLEGAVRLLEADRWIVQHQPNDLTIPQALDTMKIENGKNLVTVSMKREQIPLELPEILLKDKEVPNL